MRRSPDGSRSAGNPIREVCELRPSRAASSRPSRDAPTWSPRSHSHGNEAGLGLGAARWCGTTQSKRWIDGPREPDPSGLFGSITQAAVEVGAIGREPAAVSFSIADHLQTLLSGMPARIRDHALRHRIFHSHGNERGRQHGSGATGEVPRASARPNESSPCAGRRIDGTRRRFPGSAGCALKRMLGYKLARTCGILVKVPAASISETAAAWWQVERLSRDARRSSSSPPCALISQASTDAAWVVLTRALAGAADHPAWPKSLVAPMMPIGPAAPHQRPQQRSSACRWDWLLAGEFCSRLRSISEAIRTRAAHSFPRE